MAAALAEIAEGAAEEGAESKSGFTEDSEESASSQGVEISKLLSGGLSLASTILGLVSSISKGTEETTDIVNRRLASGLVTARESRKALVNRGKIPAYYAASNIRRLLSDGTLPYGWSATVASSQGFAPDVRAFLLRQRRSQVAATRDALLKRALIGARLKAAAAKSNLEARTRAVVDRLKQSVIG
jgi:hypothetical protein